MKSPISIKRGATVLIKNIIIAEITIGLFALAMAFFINYEGIYKQSIFNKIIRYDYSLIIAASLLQLMATLIVFWQWHNRYYEKRLSILDLILGGESHYLEFKQTFRWDAKEKSLNKGLEKNVFKTMAGFLNTDGGNVIIGVSDDKSVFGLENDYKTLARRDRDGFENHFSQMFNNVIGVKFRRFIKINFESIDNKDICLIEVSPGDEPAYISLNVDEEFYIRSGNITCPLSVSKVADYIKSRWK